MCRLIYLLLQVVAVKMIYCNDFVLQFNLSLVIEKMFVNDVTEYKSCPNSFILKIVILDHLGYTKEEFLTMRDKSEILNTIEEKRKSYTMNSTNKKHHLFPSMFYFNEDNIFNDNHILSSIICDNLRIKGVLIIANSTFFISPQHFKFKTELKFLKESENFFYKSNYQINDRKRKSFYSLAAELPQRNIEIYLVVDKTMTEKYFSEENTICYLYEVLAYLNMISQQLMITLYPVKIVFEKELNLENDLHNIDNALNRISKYRQTNVTDQKHDILHFISGLPFFYYSGRTYLRGMCHFKKSVAIISDYYSNHALRTAIIMAHEIAHSLGIDHDGVYCNCFTNSKNCIMTNKATGRIPNSWSNCSLQSLLTFNGTGIDYCLNDKPEFSYHNLTSLENHCSQSNPSSKNYCNLENQNWNLEPSLFEHCCNIKTCQLTTNSQCFSGECCDPNTCKFLTSSNICRQPDDECDIPEYCSGKSGNCPANKFSKNGSNCKNKKGHCFNGKCGSANLSCQTIFGSNFVTAKEECYIENIKGTSFQGHCGYTIYYDNITLQMEYKYLRCRRDDIFCGTLKCDFNFKNRNASIKWLPSLENINYISYEDKTTCYFGLYNTNLTGLLDPTMVPNGSPCGHNKYCIDQRCVEI